jgi:hypothetical protein
MKSNFTNKKSIVALFVAVVATLSIGILAGCGSGGGGGNTDGNSTGNNGNAIVADNRLLPTQAGHGWTYRFTEATGGEPVNYFISYGGTATFNGQSAHKLLNSDAPTVPSYIAITGEGIADLGSTGDTNTNDWAVRFDLLPGQSREFTATHTSGSLSGTERYRIARLLDETLTVPAGTFNCVVFQRTILENTGSVTTGAVGDISTFWYAPNVGPVKTTDQTGSGTLASVSTVILQAYGPIS